MQTITNISTTYYTDMMAQVIKTVTGAIAEEFTLVQRDVVSDNPKYKIHKMLAYNVKFTTLSGGTGELKYAIDPFWLDYGEEVLRWELRIDGKLEHTFTDEEVAMFMPFEIVLLDLFVTSVRRIELTYRSAIKGNELSSIVKNIVENFLTDFFNQLNNDTVKVIQANAMLEPQWYIFKEKNIYDLPTFALIIRSEDGKLMALTSGLN